MIGDRQDRTDNPVAITAMGMVCALGLDIDTACAASRAGIRRTEELEYFFRSPLDGSTQPAFGNVVPFITRGFEGQARLRRLLEAALNDLKHRIADDCWPSETPIYVALPDSGRVRNGTALIADESDREYQEEDAEYPLSSPPDWRAIIEQAVRACGWRCPAPVRQVFTSGHTGVAEALQRALADISAGHSPAAIVGGVDSLTCERTLAWLERTRRLRTPGLPTGLIPGEAAAVFLIERQSSVESAHRRRMAVVRSVASADESRPLFLGEQSFGSVLYELIDELISEFPRPNGSSTWFVTDLNGEEYSATEWGHTVVRMAGRTSAYPDPVYWYPAASFGDVGAAMGAVSLCMAVKAWERGYAPAAAVIVTSASEGPRRAATLLEFESATCVGGTHGR